jgi:hypothetical protein
MERHIIITSLSNNQLFRPVEHPLTARSFIYINVVYSVVVFFYSLLSARRNQHKRNINKYDDKWQ